MLQPDDLALFQGGSNTDVHRIHAEVDNLFQLGTGYATMAAARVRRDRPLDRISFINRGVSGNTTRDPLARWRPDCLDFRPTVLSLLIGNNNANAFARGDAGHADHAPERSLERLHRLLQMTRDHLPKAKLILLEPFVLPFDGQRVSQIDDMKQRPWRDTSTITPLPSGGRSRR